MGRLKKIGELFWDALFPRACVLCATEGEIFCHECRQQKELPSWHMHAEREGLQIFSRVSYKERAVQRLLHAWKYRGDSAAGEYWQKWIGETDACILEVFRGALFVPVPLAKEAYAERGFNQAEMLAHALAARHGGSVGLLLERFPKKAQAKTEKESRGNIREKNPYQASLLLQNFQKEFPHNPQIILVDDVYTTGSTIMACRDILKKEGIGVYHACTLAYGNAA